MRIVAKEKISDNLSLHVVTGENESLAEKLDIYLDKDYYAYLAKYKNIYLPTNVWGIDGEDDEESMIDTMRAEADWHRANPDKIGNTDIWRVDQLIQSGKIYSDGYKLGN